MIDIPQCAHVRRDHARCAHVQRAHARRSYTLGAIMGIHHIDLGPLSQVYTIYRYRVLKLIKYALCIGLKILNL